MNLLDTLDLSRETSAIARMTRRMELRSALADSEQHSDFAARLLLLVEEMRREGITEISAAELTDVAQAFAELGQEDEGQSWGDVNGD